MGSDALSSLTTNPIIRTTTKKIPNAAERFRQAYALNGEDTKQASSALLDPGCTTTQTPTHKCSTVRGTATQTQKSLAGTSLLPSQ